MKDDATLLRCYAEERSQDAFAELVQRHLPLVYAAAVRRTNGDAHRAEDVAQQVFTVLARDAGKLAQHPALTGWLYTATRHAATDVMRAERRRTARELEAQAMQEQDAATEPAADWEKLRPVLDAVMDELDERDREAVLVRYFQGGAFAAVAAALRTNEDAARKRVDRALDKLHALLARRGISSTTGALAVVLANQAAATAVPAALAGTITTAALAGAATAAVGGGAVSALGILKLMSTTKIIAGVSGVIALLAVGSAVYEANAARDAATALSAAGREREALRAQLVASEQRAKEADDSRAAGQKELAEARASAAKVAAAPVAAPATRVSGPIDYVLDHPETHAAFLEQQVLRAKSHYEAFTQAAGLTGEQREAFAKAIEGWVGGELDLMNALHAQGYGVGSLPSDPAARAQLQQLATEKRNAFQANLQAALGDEGLKKFQVFGATIPERNVADQLAARLYRTDAPLTPQQADQLAQVLAQNRFSGQPTPVPTTTLNGNFVSRQTYGNAIAQLASQGGMAVLEWHAPVTDAALAKAETVLSASQLAALKQLQAQQLAQLRLAPPPPSAAGRK